MGIFDDADAQVAAQSGNATIPPATLRTLFGADAPVPAAPPLDKYQQAAIVEYDRNPAIQGRTKGISGYTERIRMGIPWSDEILAGNPLSIGAGMIERGTFNPAEAYRYNKARENLIGEKARENTPGGAIAEVAGGLATGAGVLGSGTRLGAATIGGVTVPAKAVNYGVNVGKAGAFGAFAGAGEGDTLEDRAKHALIGGALGTGLGATLPAVAPAFGVASRFMQMPRLRDPEKIATEQIAKVARDAGVTMDELGQRLAAARAAGQPDFTVVDALGKEAQRKLAAMAKVPGPARERITDILTTRDLNMPERVGAEVGRKMGAPVSAEAARETLIRTARENASPLYGQAEQVTTWSPKLQDFWADPDIQRGMQRGLKMQMRNARGTGRPFDPNDYAITGFNEAGDAVISGVPNMKTIQAAKEGLDELIEAQIDPVTRRVTKEGASLIDMKNRMLAEIDSLNPMYREARRAYAGPMQVDEAVAFGQRMPTHGRAVDNIRQYEGRPPTAQQGIRIGVADKVRGDLERTGNFPTYLREKSLKGQQELEAISPYGPATLREALAREEQMQRTSRQALGGSQTAENLADIAQGPGGAETLGLIGNIASGNTMGAIRGGAELLARVGRGESEAQRSAIARALLANDPAAIEVMQRRIAEHELRRRGVNPFVSRAPRYRAGE